MKLRTTEELVVYLQDDLAWRRKEIRVWEGVVRGTTESRQQAVLRGAIASLYAHWEGFVKTASSAYIDYVRLRRLRICDLRTNFVGLIVRGRIRHLATGGRTRDFTDFVDWLLREWNSRAFFPTTEKLSTQSNLTASVFRDIVDALGLPYRKDYAIAEKTVVEPLLADRNHLAHGEWQITKQETFEQYAMWIERLLVFFNEDIQDAAILLHYKRDTSTIA